MRVEDPERYLAPAGRGSEVMAGFAIGFFGVLFLGFLALGIAVFAARGVLFKPWETPVYIFAGALLLLGSMCLFLARRLITGHGRRDGGLFAPAFLRIAGAVLIAFTWWWVWTHPRDWLAWSHLLFMTSAGIACFILAARREDALSRSQDLGPAGAGQANDTALRP